MFCRIVVQKNFTILQGKELPWLASLLKKGFHDRLDPVSFFKKVQGYLFSKRLRKTTSVGVPIIFKSVKKIAF